MESLILEKLKEEYENKYQSKKQTIEQENNLVLQEELIDFFLKKVDVFKLKDRIAKQFNIQDLKSFKEFLNIPQYINLTEALLKKAYKDNDIPNKILTEDEKLSLRNLFLKNIKFRLDKKREKEANVIEHKRRNLLSLIKSCEKLVSDTKNKNILKKKQKENIKKHIDNIHETCKDKEVLTIDETYTLAKYEEELKTIFEKTPYEDVRDSRERQLSLEYMQKAQDFKKKQDQELIERINNRKNGLLAENEKTDSRIEPIIIEAYLEDFNSEQSRRALSVLTTNNIYLAFYNGLIKLINEDESFEEIYFSTTKNTITFTNEKYSKDILINIDSIDKIGEVISSQTNNKIQHNQMLDCLSILYYIKTFYNEQEKMDISFENIETIILNEKDTKDVNKFKSVVYLNKNKNKNTIKTIKIKKGKRKINGTFLTRGHWRNQRYLNGTKLIWIEPFWKGVGKLRKRVYKINT